VSIESTPGATTSVTCVFPASRELTQTAA
jgi:hypothetical protein